MFSKFCDTIWPQFLSALLLCASAVLIAQQRPSLSVVYDHHLQVWLLKIDVYRPLQQQAVTCDQQQQCNQQTCMLLIAATQAWQCCGVPVACIQRTCNEELHEI